MGSKKVCFFVTPIGHANSVERKRADNIKRYILNDVLSRKFTVVRADELPQPGSISHQVIKMLYFADLVVADLTGTNPNVVYELAVRHAFNKISIHLIDRAEQIPFDLKDERTVMFDLADPDSVNDCKLELAKVVKEMDKKKFEYSSPVFRVLGVAAATPEEKEGFLEKMADQIESVASSVSSIETTLDFAEFDGLDHIKDIGKDTADMKADIRKILDQLSRGG
jgi:hypothetical protein